MIRRLGLSSFLKRCAAPSAAVNAVRCQSASNNSLTPEEDVESFYDDFDFSYLDELCDEISGDLGTFIPERDFSLLGRENSKGEN